jgi:hypothetical protein
MGKKFRKLIQKRYLKLIKTKHLMVGVVYKGNSLFLESGFELDYYLDLNN